MEESERMQRFKRAVSDGDSQSYLNAIEDDEKLSDKIIALLNRSDISSMNMVDAYYYDYSVLPGEMWKTHHGDMYLIFGITDSGEMITKWVDRWDLDSSK